MNGESQNQPDTITTNGKIYTEVDKFINLWEDEDNIKYTKNSFDSFFKNLAGGGPTPPIAVTSDEAFNALLVGSPLTPLKRSCPIRMSSVWHPRIPDRTLHRRRRDNDRCN